MFLQSKVVQFAEFVSFFESIFSRRDVYESAFLHFVDNFIDCFNVESLNSVEVVKIACQNTGAENAYRAGCFFAAAVLLYELVNIVVCKFFFERKPESTWKSPVFLKPFISHIEYHHSYVNIVKFSFLSFGERDTLTLFPFEFHFANSFISVITTVTISADRVKCIAMFWFCKVH